MNTCKVNKVLGAYNFVLALGAFYAGINMILGKGIFSEYPQEWLEKVPFENWVIPGIIVVLLFGLGNLTASLVTLRVAGRRGWVLSILMGAILLISLYAQVKIIGEWYMATIQFILFSIIQVSLAFLYLYTYNRAKH